MGDYRGDQYLFQGLSSLGNQLAEAIAEHRQTKDLAKAATVFFNHQPDEEKAMPSEAFDNLSSRDKIAHVKGLVQAQGYKQGQVDLMARLAGVDATKANTEALKQITPERLAAMQAQTEAVKAANVEKADMVKRIAGFNTAMKERMGPGEYQAPAPMQPDELFSMIASHGLAMDPQSDNTLMALGRVHQMNDATAARGADATPQAIEVGGNPFVFNRKTGMMLPNPKQGEAEAVPLVDPDTGESLGHAVRNPKTGAFTMIPMRRQGSADLIRYEEAIGNLDSQIGYQEKLKSEGRKDFNADALSKLQQRRAAIHSEYQKAFPATAAPTPGAAPAAPGAAAPVKSNNPTWRNGKLVFPK